MHITDKVDLDILSAQKRTAQQQICPDDDPVGNFAVTNFFGQAIESNQRASWNPFRKKSELSTQSRCPVKKWLTVMRPGPGF